MYALQPSHWRLSLPSPLECRKRSLDVEPYPTPAYLVEPAPKRRLRLLVPLYTPLCSYPCPLSPPREHFCTPSVALSRLALRQHRNAPPYSVPSRLSVFLRSELVTWLFQLNHAFCYNSETAHIALNYIDRYAARVRVSRRDHAFNLATVAFYLAAKFAEEDREPRAKDIAECTQALGRPIAAKDVYRLEKRMLATLDHDMLVVTPQAALAEIFKCANGCPEEFYKRTVAQLDSVVEDYECIGFGAVTLALACLKATLKAETGQWLMTAIADVDSLASALDSRCYEECYQFMWARRGVL